MRANFASTCYKSAFVRVLRVFEQYLKRLLKLLEVLSDVLSDLLAATVDFHLIVGSKNLWDSISTRGKLKYRNRAT